MRIVELQINDEDLFSGFEAIALVNQPAHEAGFHAFNTEDVEDAIALGLIYDAFSEQFVDRLPGEDQDSFLGRCIPQLIKEGYDEEQAAAICYATMSQEVVKKKLNSHQFESYNDYPESAVNAARRALEWRDSHPDGDCGTRVGWARANQLANRENISEETIARMASFARHLQHEDVPYSEGCGGLMVDAWGSRAGIEWAQRKLEQIRQDMSLPVDKLFDNLPEGTQERILETLLDIGISKDTVEVYSEEEFIERSIFSVIASDAKPDLPTNDTNGSYKILYSYEGPNDSKTRGFCKKLLSLDLLFRKEDINRLSIKGANDEFGMYDIFEYKGSFGCRHKWVKKYVYQKSALDSLGLLGVVTGDQMNNPNAKFSKHTFSVDGDLMRVSGPAMIPDKLILRVDDEGNPYYVYFSKETVKAIANKMMKNKLLDKVNLEHDPDSPVDGYAIESWIIDDPKNDKSRTMGLDYPEGTWMMTYQIESPDVWKLVKNGTLTGYSIEGFFSDRLVQS